jgi:hypothetical protein
VQGPWDKPQVSLQIGDILNNREQIQNTIRSVRERFKGKNTKEILRGVLGDGKDGNAVGKALQGLFR